MSLAEQAAPFLSYLETWLAERPVISLKEAVPAPDQAAVVSVDVINGFLYDGPLSSPRVAAIDEPLTHLMQTAWDYGVREMVLIQEGHTEDSLEFDAYGAHAILGTPQAETIDKIKALPFYDQLLTFYKDSIHPAINTDFENWLLERPHLDTFIVVGDVTDLCVYHLATYLKFHANAYRHPRRVIVPENCVQTWHLSVEAAAEIPAMPHHGDLLHATFLYHMALNAVEVVKAIQA
ncbi:MAG: cysteine hydrolase [Chloroflexi bacterium]|jgi:nicotinamidase-related amidase|nr:cysteine hydrolase [Chloroflexota bacterium]